MRASARHGRAAHAGTTPTHLRADADHDTQEIAALCPTAGSPQHQLAHPVTRASVMLDPACVSRQ